MNFRVQLISTSAFFAQVFLTQCLALLFDAIRWSWGFFTTQPNFPPPPPLPPLPPLPPQLADYPDNTHIYYFMPSTDTGIMAAVVVPQDPNQEQQLFFGPINGRQDDANAPHHAPEANVDNTTGSQQSENRKPHHHINVTITRNSIPRFRGSGGNIGHESPGTFRGSGTGMTVGQVIVAHSPGARSVVYYGRKPSKPSKPSNRLRLVGLVATSFMVACFCWLLCSMSARSWGHTQRKAIPV
ncbi:hypothetical protein F5Y10DRAFT_96447 [Nemania abortiva]|nr:hypothetical protein F5Y10DRAFT_96447 [Nemania abortiva]